MTNSPASTFSSGGRRGRTRSHTDRSSIRCIDLGSTQTRVSEGGQLRWQQPSCLVQHHASGAVVTVGESAYQLLGKRTLGTSLVFPMQDGVIASQEHAVALIRHIAQELGWGRSTGWFGSLFSSEVHCAQHAGVSPLESALLKTSLTEAGWHKVRFHAASQAIVQAHGRATIDAPQIIIDLGGQVSFVSIVHAGNVIHAEKVYWGGLLFTDRVQRLMLEKFQVAVSWHTAELIKRELGFVASGEIPRTRKQARSSASGKSLNTQLGTTVTVDAESVIAAIADLPELLVVLLQHFLASVSAEMVSSCLEQGVILSGGAAQLHGLRPFLEQRLKTEVIIASNPELDILKGLEQLAGLDSREA